MYGMAGFGIAASLGTLLGFVAFVAAIVVTVVLYKKFISTGNAGQPLTVKRDWGPFFRFETLMVEKIMQVLYLFVACLIAFECAAAIITSLAGLAYSVSGVFLGIVGILVLCVVLEVLVRIGFEFALMTILIWKNTSVIRAAVAGDAPVSGAVPFQPGAPVQGGGASPAPGAVPAQGGVGGAQPAQAAPQQPMQSASQQPGQPVSQNPVPQQPAQPSQGVAQPIPSQPVVSTDAGWVCSACGTANKAGSYCAQCGMKRS